MIQVRKTARPPGWRPGDRKYVPIADQPGCVVGTVYRDGRVFDAGAMVVPVDITSKMKATTIFIDVACQPQAFDP
jgi:hypothetical protein